MTDDAGEPATSHPRPSKAVAAPSSEPTRPGAPVPERGTGAGPSGNGSAPEPPDPPGAEPSEPERALPGEPLPLASALPLPTPPLPRRKSLGRLVIEWVLVLATALAAALLVQAFFLKAFFIPSGSMRPTLEIDDRVLVNKLSYDFGSVQPGDVIVFKKPDEAPPSDVEDFIKRVIAVAGDEIEARDGVVFRNGVRVDEPYLAPGTTTGNLPRQTVPEGTVWVMGDNRNFSVDSRVFGPIDEDSIVGEALVRVWPPSKIGRL